MILIIGGAGQGKERFAKKQFPALEGKIPVNGYSASWKEFVKADYAASLHEMIRRRMESVENETQLEKETARELLDGCPERILLTDEIGCGIVPIDEFSRRYRELTGRICCQLAESAQEVWRVTAGIGQRIK